MFFIEIIAAIVVGGLVFKIIWGNFFDPFS